MHKRGVLGTLLICLLAGAVNLAWAQPPPPEAETPGAVTLEVPGLGPVTPLMDLAEGRGAFSGKLEVTDAANLKLTVVLNYDP
ncbi:MAG: hypothetical protein GX100_09945, partial [candidate division WS1 bacterium]|nr:hypothetical protein [candidate division WS1 bacterium]